MSTILNIETSGTICSVALSRNGKVISFKETDTEKSHASLLTPFIDEILKSAGIKFSELNAICVSKGPGSYTGLRIGVSTAKGIAYAMDLPLIGISTLEILANGFLENFPEYREKENILLCPMIDARRMEVYTCLFTNTLKAVTNVSAEIITPDSFRFYLSDTEIVFFGDGASKCKDIISNRNAKFIDFKTISARYMNILSLIAFDNKTFEDLAYFEPYYLKDFIAGKGGLKSKVLK